jgi:hypothetical protein
MVRLLITTQSPEKRRIGLGHLVTEQEMRAQSLSKAQIRALNGSKKKRKKGKRNGKSNG